ncbi:transporter substrate-binding domain-containing protein [Vibrio hippocampi]|uniref:Membrane-bound lytic murein transglycosylase F n=1 Tax=Vibrio hippocampi TaxID=654686 RepID=A0ABN8DMC2_9VIBR|nr:transporter substrate-binding domain-containing protein [Vibrio hippocampi]CAH0529800.1 Membrane-bound lytic murein transglycosylase F [Vibrio hippocampi]
MKATTCLNSFIILLFVSICSISPAQAMEKIKIALPEGSIAPFTYLEDGRPTGYFTEYYELVAEEANVELEWEVFPNRLKLLEHAVTSLEGYITEGAKVDRYNDDFVFGDVLLPRFVGTFWREGQTERVEQLTLETLPNLIIASPVGFSITNSFKANFPQAQIVETENLKQALQMVALGTADVTFIDVATGLHIQRAELIPNLRVLPAPEFIQSHFKPVHVMYSKAFPEALRNRFEQARERLDPADVDALKQKWFIDFRNNDVELNLTQEERNWLLKAPTIRVSAYENFAPFVYEKNGRLKGYSIDYLDLIAKRLGIQFVFDASKTWDQQLDMAKDRNLDVLQFIRYREEIDQYMDFTSSYFEGSETAFFGRAGAEPIESLDQAGDKVIAATRGYLEQRYLSKNYPELNVQIYSNQGEGINAVLRGEADYYLCEVTTCNTHLYKNFISNVEIKGYLEIESVHLANKARLAIRDDWPLLISAVDKAIESITRDELRDLRDKWMTITRERNDLIDTLSTEEKQWLQRHPRLAFSSALRAAPFGYIDDKGELGGAAVDILDRFESHYDLRSHLVAYESWKDTYNALVDGELDFVMTMNVTPERKKELLFTHPTHKLTYSIHTQLDKQLLSNITDLIGKKIGGAKGSGIVEKIKAEYPQIKIEQYRTLQDSLRALSNGEVDAVIENPMIVRYLAQTMGINNIKVSGDTEYSLEIAIGVHPSKPELVSLFNKVIASIGSEQMTLLTEKWGNVTVIEKNRWQPYLLWGLGISLLFISVTVSIAYYNRRKTLAMLQKTSHQLGNAQRVAKLGSLEFDSENRLHSLSQEAAHIIGVAQGRSMSRLDFVQMIYQPDREQYQSAWAKALATGLVNVEYRLEQPDGLKWVNEIAECQFGSNGKLVGGSAIIQDISLFKSSQQALIEGQKELRELASKLLNVQEEERKRVARELHDDLSQRLAVLSIEAGTLEMTIEDVTTKQSLKKIKKGLVGIAEDTHGLSRRLHPSILDDLGLVEALRSEIDNFRRREEIEVSFFCSTKKLDLASDSELAVFRIVQEALRNVSKYSEASRVEVNIATVRGNFVLQITDDGMGFDVAAARIAPGLGLKSMMERSRLIGGQLDISSEENKGTTIELVFNASQQRPM